MRKITLYQSFVKYMKAGCGEVTDIALLEQLSRAEAELGVNRAVELYTNNLVSSPLLFGFFRPCLVFPEANLPEGDFRYTVWHELTHYKRGDMFYKWLVQLTICVHWFNPLVYLMGREVNRACELSCDEAVAKRLDGQGRRDYGDTLMRAMGAGESCPGAAMAVLLNESVELLKERLKAIMDYKKSSKGVKALVFLFTLLFMAGASVLGVNASTEDGNALPLSVARGEEGSPYRYTQEGYFQDSWLFEIGWNVREEKAAKEYAAREVSLPDGGTMTVFYMDACKGLWEKEDAVAALSALLLRMRDGTAGEEFPFTQPLLVSVENIGNNNAEELAGGYYQDGSLAQFAAVFGTLDEKAQRRFLEEAYEDGNVSFFAAGTARLKEGSPLIGQFAEKTYEDGEIAFFSVLTANMDENMMESWLARAEEDKMANFQAMLMGGLGRDQEIEKMQERIEAQHLEAYEEWGITKDGDFYYYQGRRVGILVDSRPDSSFCRLSMNPKGEVNLKVTRNEKEEIVNVDYMAQEEVAELLGEREDPEDEGEFSPEMADEDREKELKDGGAEEGVSRLSKEQLPGGVQEALDQCAVREWYLISFEGQQYLYIMDGNNWQYAYQPVRTAEGWEITVLRVRKQSTGYFLLVLPDDAPVRVRCDGEEAELKEIVAGETVGWGRMVHGPYCSTIRGWRFANPLLYFSFVNKPYKKNIKPKYR